MRATHRKRRQRGIPGLRSAANIARCFARHPSWLPAYARSIGRRRRLAASFTTEPEYPAAVDFATAVERLLGLAPAELEQIAARRLHLAPDGDPYAIHDNAPLMLDLLAALVATRRPATIVETGVGRGASSAVMLNELRRAGHGQLHSIDLPMLSVHAGRFIGQLVPSELRGSWDLRLGPSQALLPPLLDSVGQIDLFIHDSEPTWENQLYEYRTVWPHLSDGGFMVSNTVWWHRAFEDFAREVGVQAVIIRRADSNTIGVIRAPG